VSQSFKVTAIVHANGWTCQVTIDEKGRTISEHTVEVKASDLKRLAPQSSVEDLVTRSFEFLLEREAPSSILRSFDLMDIERYFPEYPRVITNQY
jgi:YD repeat-containing protein